MDSIKPEKDEVDLRRLQKKGQGNAGGPNKPVEPIIKSTDVSLSRSGQWALVFLFLIVVSLAALGYWQVKQQQATIKLMEEQLSEANTFISRSKLIAARLEGQINQTDATMAQSGNELARELKVLDSEIRKLWDVANKRNKGWIEDNQKKLATLTVAMDAANATAEELIAGMTKIEKGVEGITPLQQKVAELADSLQKQAGLLSGQQKNIKDTYAQISNNIAELQATGKNLAVTQEALSDQLVKSITGMETKLATNQKSVQALATRFGKSTPDANTLKRLQSLEASMEGLDKVRGQLVQRIVQLDSRINEMQLEIEAL